VSKTVAGGRCTLAAGKALQPGEHTVYWTQFVQSYTYVHGVGLVMIEPGKVASQYQPKPSTGK
jgi:hypothetical protein